MNKLLLLSFMSVLMLGVSAQTFDFDMTKPQSVYSVYNGAGYDILLLLTRKNQLLHSTSL